MFHKNNIFKFAYIALPDYTSPVYYDLSAISGGTYTIA